MSAAVELQGFLNPTPTIQSDHPAVADFAAAQAPAASAPREAAVRLYYAVRDGIRYDPYRFDLTEEGLSASKTLEAGHGWCVPKAILLAACCRSRGIPARLGYADVRNHLSTARMRETMNTDVFYWHGYTSLHLEGRWVKATPAFNLSLCQKFGLEPLEFDGRRDSLFHPFDTEGQRHMEYLNERGEYMLATFAEHYASFMQAGNGFGGDFDRDVEAETA
jgi:transglutaminase-like putative cysteine protease